MNEQRYFLGCPVWNCDGWKGSVYRRKTPKTRWLEDYSRAFDTVEGNSTFYGLPSLETVKKWIDLTPDDFRFSLKFPRSITHDLRLIQAERMTQPFLELLDYLANGHRLGPTFLQLPPDFSFIEWHALEKYLHQLPKDMPFAVEVRNPDYFDAGEHENELDSLLSHLNMDRVLFDSRALFSKPPGDDSERTSQKRKPNPPYRNTVTGSHPFVRIVGRNRLDECSLWLDDWAKTTGEWIEQGLTPVIFTHSPNDTFAPELANYFHESLMKQFPAIPPRPEFPGNAELPPIKQKTLF